MSDYDQIRAQAMQMADALSGGVVRQFRRDSVLDAPRVVAHPLSMRSTIRVSSYYYAPATGRGGGVR